VICVNIPACSLALMSTKRFGKGRFFKDKSLCWTTSLGDGYRDVASGDASADIEFVVAPAIRSTVIGMGLFSFLFSKMTPELRPYVKVTK
jgi:hypothetical protein